MKDYHIKNTFKREWRKKILHWYSSNKRDLPWRRAENQNFYRVWISEIMLQQTQVSVVIPFYNRFINKWPTLKDFYTAKLDDILLIWQGMGYYRRAHNLYKAKEILKKKTKIVINSYFLKKLPGIGDYTSCAISAILEDESCSVIDGNIKRVLSRVFGLDANDKSFKRLIDNISESLTPEKKNGDYCQSLMDLANLVCKVTKPDCEICPVFQLCESKGGIKRKIKKKIVIQKVAVAFVIGYKEKFLIQKNSESLLQNLYCFPLSEFNEITEDFEKREYLNQVVSEWTEKKTIKNSYDFVGEINHKFSHFQLKVLIVKLELSHRLKFNDLFWLTNEELNEKAVSKLMKKLREKIE